MDNTIVPLDDLEQQADALMKSVGPDNEEQLAALIPMVWAEAGSILNYQHLKIGKYVNYYCEHRLWRLSDYRSFKEAWESEGIPDVSYAAVKGWQYAYQCQQLARLSLTEAAVQPIGKLISAKPILNRALGRDLGEIDQMISDLANTEISQEMWVDRYSETDDDDDIPQRDRATIDSATGNIMYWINTGKVTGIGIPMGIANMDNDAMWAWDRVLGNEVGMEWG